MQDHKNALTKIKNFFTDLFKVENSESKTSDGTSIYYEGDLAEGTDVYSDADMTTALADGDYTLEDGRTLTVADGSVSSIAEAENSEDDNKEDATKIEELENRIQELEAENSELTNALQNSTEALNKIRNVKSNHTPKDKKTNFKKSKDEEGDDDLLEKMNERRNEIRNKGKKGA